MLLLGHGDKVISARLMGDDVVLATDLDGNALLKSLKRVISTVFFMEVSETKSRVVKAGLPFFYMGFLTDDKSKVMNVDLLRRKLIMTGRFVPKTMLDKNMLIWSKYCSICASCSNGYAFWLKHKSELLRLLEMDQPTYYHDLNEGPNKPFDVNRIIQNAEAYVQGAWAYN
jgi:hypothetical protein